MRCYRSRRKYRSVLLCKSSDAACLLKLFELICFSMFHTGCQQQAAAAVPAEKEEEEEEESLRGAKKQLHFTSAYYCFITPTIFTPRNCLSKKVSLSQIRIFCCQRKSFCRPARNLVFGCGEKSSFVCLHSTCWPCGALRLTVVETLVSRSDPRLLAQSAVVVPPTRATITVSHHRRSGRGFEMISQETFLGFLPSDAVAFLISAVNHISKEEDGNIPPHPHKHQSRTSRVSERGFEMISRNFSHVIQPVLHLLMSHIFEHLISIHTLTRKLFESNFETKIQRPKL